MILGDRMITEEQLDNWFMYHPPSKVQQEQYIVIRDAARTFAKILVEHTPASADQTAAIRKVREAVMTANASIACDGK
jgi:hypothetical protein